MKRKKNSPRTGLSVSPRDVKITLNIMLYPVQSCIEAAQDLTPHYWVHLDLDEDNKVLKIRLEPREDVQEQPDEREVLEFFNYVLHVMRRADLIKPL